MGKSKNEVFHLRFANLKKLCKRKVQVFLNRVLSKLHRVIYSEQFLVQNEILELTKLAITKNSGKVIVLLGVESLEQSPHEAILIH